jgi:hypothetical protein
MSIPDTRPDRRNSNGDHGTLARSDRATAAPVKPPRYSRVEIGGFRPVVTVILMVVLFAAGVGDFVNAKTVFDLVFTQSGSVYAWVLAISLTAMAIIVSHAAGYLWREAQHHRGLKALSALMLVAWLAAGGLLAALRVVIGSTGNATSGQAGNPLAGLQNAGGSAPHPLVVALVLAAVWVATGLVSFALGYLAHAPAGAALARLEASTAKESQRLGEARRDESQAAHTKAAQQVHKTRLREAWRQADARAAAHRDELRAWARGELVRVLGDPAATNDILPPASTD